MKSLSTILSTPGLFKLHRKSQVPPSQHPETSRNMCYMKERGKAKENVYFLKIQYEQLLSLTRNRKKQLEIKKKIEILDKKLKESEPKDDNE